MTCSPSPIRVAVVDYGLGNLFSVKHACERVGMQASVTASRNELLNADGILLPGVGAFGDAMQCLERLKLVDVLREAAALGKPLVGICLGMQLLMSESSEFGRHRGLNLLEGEVVRFEQPRGPRGVLKVPQVGWNRVRRPITDASKSCAAQPLAPGPSLARKEGSRTGQTSASLARGETKDIWSGTPLDGLADGTSMYFVHSFYVKPRRRDAVLSLTRYGDVEFCSAVRRGNVLGFQFHPERSGQAGLRLYARTAEFIRRQTPAEIRHAA